MPKKIKIHLNGREVLVKTGESISRALKLSPHPGHFQPLGAVVNNRLVDLSYPIVCRINIHTLDLASREGVDIYRRSASVILFAAAKEIVPDVHLMVGQSVNDGYFYEFKNGRPTEKIINSIEKEMRRIVDADHLIKVKYVLIEEAERLLIDAGERGTSKLFDQMMKANVTIVELKKYLGYAHGPLVNRAGAIDKFKIYPYKHGLVLQFPNSRGVVDTKGIKGYSKLFATYLEAKRWGDVLGVRNIGEFNHHCTSGEISTLINAAESLHERKIAEIADDIAKRDKRFILIAGPSCAGKTTFAKKLAVHLKINGFEPVNISIDNYYLDRDKSPRHSDGTFNFESLEALKVKDFSRDIKDLIAGKEVLIPYFNFQVAKSDPSRSKRMKLSDHNVVITEGIHGLNDALTSTVPKCDKFKIYVSPLTQLCIDDHNRIFTTDIRLIRRIVRDRMYRNANAEATIAGWKSVRAGEDSHIFPFQESADVVFNSALFYEFAVLKSFAERFLIEVPRKSPSFIVANRLMRFFSLFVPILSREVPQTSILREFIGGSSFSYK